MQDVLQVNTAQNVSSGIFVELVVCSASCRPRTLCLASKAVCQQMALQEDFRISVRKGLSLLRAVRQIESKPKHELLSPTRLHNVTAIERMLVQLGTRLSLLMLFLRSKKVQNSVIESHCKEAALIFANSFPLLTLRMALVFIHSYLTLNSVNEWKLRVVALFAPCKEMFQSRGIQ